MKKYKKFDKLEIHWLDSLHTSGWKSEEDIKTSDKELEHTSVGYFMREDKRSIVLIQSYQLGKDDGDTNVDAIMEIPKCSILKIKIVI